MLMLLTQKSGTNDPRFFRLHSPYVGSLIAAFIFAWPIILAGCVSIMLLRYSLGWLSILLTVSLLSITAVSQMKYLRSVLALLLWKQHHTDGLIQIEEQSLYEGKDDRMLYASLLSRTSQAAIAFERPFQHIGVHTEVYRQEIKEAVDTLYKHNADLQAFSLCLLRLLQAARQNWAELAAFSPREREVLELLSQNISYKEMSRRLHVSSSTIKTHVYHIFQKLNISNREEAISIIRQRGWFLTDEYNVPSAMNS